MNNLQHAKALVNINHLWNKYSFPDQPKKLGSSPFRPDKHPSFSVYAHGHRWKDFSTGECGDQIDFLAKAEGLDNKAACKKFLQLANGFRGGI